MIVENEWIPDQLTTMAGYVKDISQV